MGVDPSPIDPRTLLCPSLGCGATLPPPPIFDLSGRRGRWPAGCAESSEAVIVLGTMCPPPVPRVRELLSNSPARSFAKRPRARKVLAAGAQKRSRPSALATLSFLLLRRSFGYAAQTGGSVAG